MKILFTIVFSFFYLPFSLQANDIFFVLYGFKIGQSRSVATNQYGKPFKTHKFEDGYSYDLFKMKDHFLVLESNHTRPDLIWAIQIQGKSNPEYLGLNGLNLGDSSQKVSELFGAPDEKRESIDEKTQEKMKGIEFWSYDQSRNFSVEITDGKVSSIKLSFKGQLASEETYNLQPFLDLLKQKDFYRISESVSVDLTLKTKKEYKIEKSIYESIREKGEFNDAFFHGSHGLITFTEADIVQSIPIKKEEVVIATYFKLQKSKLIYHLFFLRNYDGWVLKEMQIES